MTKVSYIHGIGNTSQHIPKKLARKRIIDFGEMTEGELRLSLMSEQLNILAEYYGDDELNALEQRVTAAIGSGIHGPHDIRLISGKRGQFIAREISKARRLTKAAIRNNTIQRNFSNGINGLVPLEDCDDLREWIDDRYGLNSGAWAETQESTACRERNESLRLLNNYLEGSAHHLLYEYLGTTSAPTPATKKVLHRNAISKLAELTGVSRENLRLWLRNGVMRKNVEHGAAPLQPELVISTLKASKGQSSVGAVQFLSILPALISAIAGAVLGTISLVQNMKAQKRQQLITTAQGIGTETFGPELGDWLTNGSDTNSTNPGDLLADGNSNLPLLLVGAAAIYALS